MKITLPPINIERPDIDVLTPDDEPLFKQQHLSHSQVEMYKRCSMQYYFRYRLGLKERPSMALAIGKGGHTALEINGRHKIATGSDMKTSDLLDAASTFIDREVEDMDKEDRKTDEEITKDRALASVRVYREQHAPAIKPAGVEVPFMLDLNEDGETPIKPVAGKIDLITTDTKIIDYKFSSRAKSQADVDLSSQLTLYAKVFNRLTGRMPQNVGLFMFLPGSTRTPPDARMIERTPEMMAAPALERRFKRLAYTYRETARSIEADIRIPTDDPRVCSWCGFRERCQDSLVDDFEAATIRLQGR